MLASVSLDDGVAPLILQLLQCALCGSKAVEQTKSGNTGTAAGPALSSSAPGSAASAVSPAKSKREDKTDSKSNADVRKKEGEQP